MTHHKRFSCIALVVALLLLVGACAAPAQEPAAAPDAAGDAAPTGEPQTGGTITFGLPWDAINLNPITQQDGVSYLVNLWIYDALVRIDKDLNPVPELAESWETSDDGLTWTLHLREDVTWHDGEPFTANDVAFTVYKILEPTTNTASRTKFSALVGFDELTNADNPATPDDLEQAPVEVVDDYTVRFHLARPYAAFLAISLHLPIAPAHLLQDVEDINTAEFNTNPVGTGPFQFVDWQKENRMVLQANEDYYGERPYLDELVLRVIPDETVLLQELRTGGIDFMERVPRDAVPGLIDDPEFEVQLVDNVGFTNIAYNQEKPIVSDKNVRQAVAHALDREGFIQSILLGYALPATGPYPPNTWYYEPDVQTYPYDPEKSRQILEEAGWTMGEDGIREKDGERLSFTISTFRGHQVGEQFLTIAKEQLAEVGIELIIEISELAVWFDTLLTGDYQATMFNWDGNIDPDDYAFALFHTTSSRNRARYINPDLDGLIEAGRFALDRDERVAAYSELQQVAAEDIPYFPLYHYQHTYAHHARFQGFIPSPVPADIYRSVKQVWIQP